MSEEEYPEHIDNTLLDVDPRKDRAEEKMGKNELHS